MQVACADIVLLNKTDGCSADQIARITADLRQLNTLAPIVPAQRSAVPLDAILHLRAYLSREPPSLLPSGLLRIATRAADRKGRVDRSCLSGGGDASRERLQSVGDQSGQAGARARDEAVEPDGETDSELACVECDTNGTSAFDAATREVPPRAGFGIWGARLLRVQRTAAPRATAVGDFSGASPPGDRVP